MDQTHVDQLLDPQTIARAEALGLQARLCSGPKGRNSIAQGNALGPCHNKSSPALKGRNRVRSIRQGVPPFQG